MHPTCTPSASHMYPTCLLPTPHVHLTCTHLAPHLHPACNPPSTLPAPPCTPQPPWDAAGDNFTFLPALLHKPHYLQCSCAWDVLPSFLFSYPQSSFPPALHFSTWPSGSIFSPRGVRWEPHTPPLAPRSLCCILRREQRVAHPELKILPRLSNRRRGRGKSALGKAVAAAKWSKDEAGGGCVGCCEDDAS